jgi:hypothetical protein
MRVLSSITNDFARYLKKQTCEILCKNMVLCFSSYTPPQGAQIAGIGCPWRLNFVEWHLIFQDPQHGPCITPPLWRLEFRSGSQIFGKSVRPCHKRFTTNCQLTELDYYESTQERPLPKWH